MSALHSAKQMMSVAEKEAGVAMWLLPPAVMIKFQFTLSKGEPVNLDKAGAKWREAAEKLQQTSTALQDAVAGVPPATWTGADRQAYEQQVRQVCEQLEIAATYFMAVGIALTAFAYALFTYAVFALAMGTFLGALAAACAAAMAGVVTAVSVPAFEAAAATCLTVTWVATGILAGAAQMAAAVFQGGAALTALLEYQHGNKEALKDFAQAEAAGASAALANLAQNAANAGLAYANRTGGENLPWMKEGQGKGSPISSVDLDADRDKNKDYQLGVGVEGSKGGGAVRATVGDQGLEGVEASGHVKAGDHDIAGKVGYKDSDGVFDGQGGTVSGEVSDTHTSGDGSKDKVSLGGSYDTHTGEAKGEGSYTHTGATGAQDKIGLSGGYNPETHQATGGATYSHTSEDGRVNQGGLSGGYNSETHEATGGATYTHEGLSGSQSTGKLDGSYNTQSGEVSGEGSVTSHGHTARAGYDSLGNSFYADGTTGEK